MANAGECACSAAPTLIFACSGAADVGAIADQAARKLTHEGVGKMFCLAGVGGHVPGILKTTQAAGRILAIDGCALDCTKKCLEEVSLAGFAHLRLSDMGMEKGESPVTEERVQQAAEKARQCLGA